MSDDDAPETAAVTVTLVSHELTPGAGTLLALLSAEITFSGGETLRLQGLQLRRAPQGDVELLAPQFRSRDGRWRDAVLLPDEIMLALLEQLSLERSSGQLRITTHQPEAETTVAFAPRVEHRKG